MIKDHHNPANPSPFQARRDAMGLPLRATVLNQCAVLVDLIPEDRLQDMYALIAEAMRKGEGYGVDEYPTEKHFLRDLNGGHAFCVTNAQSEQVVGAFAIANSKYYRGTDHKVADPIVIVRDSQRRRGIGEFMFSTCVELSERLGYSALYTDTFSNNVAMIRIIERCAGFRKVGHLPLGGTLPDGRIVGIHLYYKDLRPSAITDGVIDSNTTTSSSNNNNNNSSNSNNSSCNKPGLSR